MKAYKSKIDWCDYTIDPIIGCKHNCSYCYGDRNNKRFKMVKDWFQPEYKPKWIEKLSCIPIPSSIFVGAFTDLFGKWNDNKTINEILDIIKSPKYQDHTFMFLTKKPKRYSEFKFNSNCLLGTTVTGQGDLWRLKEIEKIQNENKFISIEPLLFDLTDLKYDGLKWIIIGGLTPYPKHHNEWIDRMLLKIDKLKIPVCIKHNTGYHIVRQEYPDMMRKDK